MVTAQIVFRSFRQITGFPLTLLRNAISLAFGNPVISREMKVRMRFARSFWLQGAYLLFLILIVLVAYQGTLLHSPLNHPAELQARLVGFYYTLLYSLVTVTVLIAPALTASAISFERERRTLDLLLTTPLRPMQILFGKLVASFAFLLLLLVESMPIITVCIIMGGVTIGDLLATYVLIGFSTLHLCAFAIYCSACNRSSGLATFWAYLGTIGILGATFWMALVEFVFATPSPTALVTPMQVFFPIASLHPFAAPVIKAAPTKLFGVELPCWLLGIVFSLLLTRFWLTAAAAKLPAVYHGNFVGSLRRQGLVLTVLAALTIDALLPQAVRLSPPPPHLSQEFTLILLVIMGFIGSFVALFVPWIATFGEHEGKQPANDGWFRPLRMFQPVASGALSFIWLWFTLLVAVVVGLFVWKGGVQPEWDLMALGFGYCTLCLTFFWAIGRFWSSILKQLSLTRWISFGTLLLITLLPLPQLPELSLAYPFLRILNSGFSNLFKAFPSQVLIHGAVVLGLTTVLIAVCVTLERREGKRSA